MAPKVDSLNMVSNTKPLSVVSKPEINSKIEVFENKKTKANIDEIDLSNQNNNNQIEEKSDNKKKWLIGAGIALGTLAIGIAMAIFLKKSHKLNLKTLSPLEEFDNYMLGVARDGKAFKPVINNPNSAFSRYYTSTQNGIIKINPTLEGFQQFIYKNADNLNISADDYYSIVKKCAKEAKIKALSDKTLGNIRNEFIENSDKIYEWR